MEGFEYMAKKLKHDFVGSGKLLTDVGLGKKMIRAVSSKDYSGKKKKKGRMASSPKKRRPKFSIAWSQKSIKNRTKFLDSYPSCFFEFTE